MATKSDITADDDFFIGEDKSLVFTVTDAAGDALNISGWSLSWMVKRRRADADGSALIVKTTDDDIALTTPGDGVCTVLVADTDTDAMLPGTLYYHELKRTDAGFETVLAYGELTLRPSVHRT